MSSLIDSFEQLSPEDIFRSVEEHCSIQLNGVLTPYRSYINRVVGVESDDNSRLIVKFYRPGRWSLEALRDEHQFLKQLAAQEIPAVAPIADSRGETLGECRGIYFAVFPLKAGRLFEINNDDDWVRIGALIGRIHRIGMTAEAPSRMVCTPLESSSGTIQRLLTDGLIPDHLHSRFRRVCEEALGLITPLFEGVDLHRIHGDLHSANILERPGEGVMLVDFDDMMCGPPVQDLWLLLPDHQKSCYVEIELLLEGYRQFNPFDNRTLRLIEPLRFMRMIYFLGWSAMQRNDRHFAEHFPGWGTASFWDVEIDDLETQLDVIREHLDEGFFG